MIDIIVTFLLGLSAGIAMYRLHIIYLVGNPGHTMCDYCRFEIKRRELFTKKKK